MISIDIFSITGKIFCDSPNCRCDLISIPLQNFRQKIIPRKTELTEQMVISDGIPAVPRNKNFRNSVPNPSAEERRTRNSVPLNKKIEAKCRYSLPNPSAEEKTTRNSVPCNQNRSELSEFSFRTLQQKRRQLGIPFRGTK